MWCGECYTTSEDMKFHIADPEYVKGVVWKRNKDELRFNVGRDGGMLLTPFECIFCWFRNLEGRFPNEENLSDKYLLNFLRRANFEIQSALKMTIQSMH